MLEKQTPSNKRITSILSAIKEQEQRMWASRMKMRGLIGSALILKQITFIKYLEGLIDLYKGLRDVARENDDPERLAEAIKNLEELYRIHQEHDAFILGYPHEPLRQAFYTLNLETRS